MPETMTPEQRAQRRHILRDQIEEIDRKRRRRDDLVLSLRNIERELAEQDEPTRAHYAGELAALDALDAAPDPVAEVARARDEARAAAAALETTRSVHLADVDALRAELVAANAREAAARADAAEVRQDRDRVAGDLESARADLAAKPARTGR